jgi:hypothetical protein
LAAPIDRQHDSAQTKTALAAFLESCRGLKLETTPLLRPPLDLPCRRPLAVGLDRSLPSAAHVARRARAANLSQEPTGAACFTQDVAARHIFSDPYCVGSRRTDRRSRRPHCLRTIGICSRPGRSTSVIATGHIAAGMSRSLAPIWGHRAVLGEGALWLRRLTGGNTSDLWRHLYRA